MIYDILIAAKIRFFTESLLQYKNDESFVNDHGVPGCYIQMFMECSKLQKL